MGYLKLDRAEANMFFQLVTRRYERGSMIITSNKSFPEWGAVLGDDILATAILDRLLHHCDVLPINGPSYRLRNRMDLIPAADPTDLAREAGFGTGRLVLAGLAAVLIYAVACARWPYASCWWCSGDGKTRSPLGPQLAQVPALQRHRQPAADRPGCGELRDQD